MRNKKFRSRNTFEWKKCSDNIGVISPWPLSQLFEYIQEINIVEAVSLFANRGTITIDLRTFCILTLFWYVYFDKARFSQFVHPTHHSSEYILDKADSRIIVQVRQPDLDAKHWKTDHIHILMGSVDPNSSINILQPVSKRHVAITNKGLYIERRP